MEAQLSERAVLFFCSQVDPLIPQNFGVANIREGKGACKLALQQRCQLQQTQAKAIVGIVTRLTTQKGIHLIKHAIHRALERGCQVHATSRPSPLSFAPRLRSS
jgi:glycogen synthase